MTTKAAFAADEWDLIADSPFLVQVAMTSHRAGGGKLSGKEYTRTLEETLATVKNKSELVQEVVAVNKDRVFTESLTFNTVKSKLQQIGTLLEKIDDQEEADALRTFLLTIGQKISEATSEGLFGLGNKVSDKEIELLDTLKVALKATEADEKRRASASQAHAKAKMEAERKKKEAAAKAKAEDEQKKKEAKAKAEAERKKKEAVADAKAEAERKKQEAEAKKSAAQATRDRLKQRPGTEQRDTPADKPAPKAQPAKAETSAPPVQPANVKTAPEQTMRIYEVKAGDSLSKIAQAVYGDLNRWKDIYEANKDKIPNPDVIEVGQKLVLPADGSPQAESRMYEVKSGDSLSKIAKEMYGQASRWEEIFEANKDQIKDPSMIHPGQKLRIP